MDFEERLERLRERHEALTQTVELMIHLHQEDHLKHEAALTKHDEALAKNQVLMAQVLESIDSLARIAHAHERRISNLEDGRA